MMLRQEEETEIERNEKKEKRFAKDSPKPLTALANMRPTRKIFINARCFTRLSLTKSSIETRVWIAAFHTHLLFAGLDPLFQ